MRRVVPTGDDALGPGGAAGGRETSADQHGDVPVEVVAGGLGAKGRPGHRAGVSEDEDEPCSEAA